MYANPLRVYVIMCISEHVLFCVSWLTACPIYLLQRLAAIEAEAARLRAERAREARELELMQVLCCRVGLLITTWCLFFADRVYKS